MRGILDAKTKQKNKNSTLFWSDIYKIWYFILLIFQIKKKKIRSQRTNKEIIKLKKKG